MKMAHRVDVYSKSVASSSSGQRVASWTLLDSNVKCVFAPGRTNVRVIPTTEQSDIDTMFFEHDANVDYGTRLYNLRDIKGGVIKAGPLEVVSIQIPTGYQGRTNHLQVRVESVIE